MLGQENMTNQNKVIAHTCLKMALQHKCSEIPINYYIKFMDSLPKGERKKILLDKETTKLIDKLNRITDCEIELKKSRR